MPENNAVASVSPNGPGTGPQIILQGRESLVADVAEKAMGMKPINLIVFGIVASFFLVIATGCYVVWDSRGKIIELLAKTTADRVEQERTKSHSTALTDFVVRDKQYKSLMASARSDLNASRAILFSYHNGTESLSGRLPFLFTSALAEDTAPGISHELERFQRVPIEASSGQVQAFLKGDCIRNDVDHVTPALAEVMKNVGTVTSMLCPVFAEVGQEPSGYVGVSYQTNWTVPETGVVYSRLKTTATALGAIQSAYIDNLRRGKQ